MNATIEREEEVFKVVFSENGCLASAIEKHHRVIYKPNEWIKARIGKIFAFNTTEDASEFILYIGGNFMVGYTHYEIWRGMGKNVDEITLLCLRWEETEMFWKGFPTGTFPAPPGTVVVDELKLLEKMT